MAETVLLDPAAAAQGTIVELAVRSGTSASTVTRFCRAIGFDGFAALRLGIAAQIGWTAARGTDTAAPIPAANDALERLLHQIVAEDLTAVRETAALLDLREVDRAAQAISGAERVEIYAASGSAGVGEQLRLSLDRLGVPGIGGQGVGHGRDDLGVRDAAMGISRSGRTQDTVDRLAKARAQGAKTIALTSFPGSPLAELADILLLTTALRPRALSARHPQLVVLDVLHAAVAQRIQGAG